MTNRQIVCIVKEQKPLLMAGSETVQQACAAMCQRRIGSVLVIDGREHLCGIFMGRDAVGILAKSADPSAMPLRLAMTQNPVTIHPAQRAIDALHLMSDGGFRHLPVVENGRILGRRFPGGLQGNGA